MEVNEKGLVLGSEYRWALDFPIGVVGITGRFHEVGQEQATLLGLRVAAEGRVALVDQALLAPGINFLFGSVISGFVFADA